MTFQIQPLSRSLFSHLFSISDAELASCRALRQTVTHKPGFPCRVSLEDAEIGEEVLLVHFEHQPADTPFRASHAVYVRANAAEARLSPGEVPAMLRSRTLSLRAFDASGMMVGAELAEGGLLEGAVEKLLANPAVACLHLHFAKPGCYAALVERA